MGDTINNDGSPDWRIVFVISRPVLSVCWFVRRCRPRRFGTVSLLHYADFPPKLHRVSRGIRNHFQSLDACPYRSRGNRLGQQSWSCPSSGLRQLARISITDFARTDEATRRSAVSDHHDAARRFCTSRDSRTPCSGIGRRSLETDRTLHGTVRDSIFQGLSLENIRFHVRRRTHTLYVAICSRYPAEVGKHTVR